MRKIILEALLVGCLGAFVAFTANEVSPRGLKVSRDYFPPPPKAATNKLAQPATLKQAHAGTNLTREALIERLRERGLQFIETKEAKELFRSPEFEQGRILFVDARDDEHYKAGHIPGAAQLDHYHPEPYLPTVLALAQAADKIIVYCNGGNCDDSEFAAVLLKDAGVPPPKLFVDGGGFTEWSTNSLPVEIGERLSGQIITNSAALKK